MSENKMVLYVYDGSFDGFLCCVYNYYYNRLKPADIVSDGDFTPSFYESFHIETDIRQADRVRFAVEEQMGRRTLEFLQKCFLTCLEEKEMYMLRFTVKGFKVGKDIVNMLSDTDVSALFSAVRHMEREVQHFYGWVRFYKAGEVYISKIAPKNQILPLLVWHFTGRFKKRDFMIYDETNHQALIYAGGKHRIVCVEDIRLPPMDRDEKKMEKLWKNFYDTIAIKERYNPKCRMTSMPKRVWANLPEMQDE